MIKILVLAFALLLPLGLNAFGIKVDKYDVPANQIEDAKSLSAVTGIMSKSVMKCMDTGKDNKKCVCENLDKLENIEKLYNSLLTKHPEWKGKMLYYETSTPEFPIYSHNTYLPGLEMQFAMKNNCK